MYAVFVHQTNISYSNGVPSLMHNHMVGRSASFLSPLYFMLRCKYLLKNRHKHLRISDKRDLIIMFLLLCSLNNIELT